MFHVPCAGATIPHVMFHGRGVAALDMIGVRKNTLKSNTYVIPLRASKRPVRVSAGIY